MFSTPETGTAEHNKHEVSFTFDTIHRIVRSQAASRCQSNWRKIDLVQGAKRSKVELRYFFPCPFNIFVENFLRIVKTMRIMTNMIH